MTELYLIDIGYFKKNFRFYNYVYKGQISELFSRSFYCDIVWCANQTF